MTLKAKFLARNGVPVIILLPLGAASIWGLWGLRQQVNLALYEYENLRIIESAESAAAKAQTFLNSDPAKIPETIAQLQSAREQAQSFGVGDSDSAPIYNREKRMSDFTAARAEDAIGKLQDDPNSAETRKQVNGNIDAMLGDMHQIASNCHEFIQTSQKAAATQRLQTTIW